MNLLLRNLCREERDSIPPGNTCISFEKDSALSFSWADDAEVPWSRAREGRYDASYV